MVRLLAYSLAWVYASLALAAGWAGLGILIFLYVIVCPLAGVWVGARVGTWCGFSSLATHVLMFTGLALFGYVRADVYRLVARRCRRLHRFLDSFGSFRRDIWPQYRRLADDGMGSR